MTDAHAPGIPTENRSHDDMDDKPVVLLADELSTSAVQVLGPRFTIRRCDGSNRPELLAALAGADAVLVRSSTTIDAEAIDAADDLKVIARAGAGLDNIDVAAAARAGIDVLSAPSSNSVSVAELAVGLMISCARPIASANSVLKAGEWSRSRFTGTEMSGKTAGLIGIGRIGGLVAARLKVFGMRVIAFDPYAAEGRAEELGVERVEFNELLSQADFISLHVAKTPETVNLIGERELRLMRRTAYIVNTSRGGIIDEVALAAALAEDRIAGAALDVFAQEPSNGSPLFDLESVTVTPHLGASTHEAQEKAGVTVAEAVRTRLLPPASADPTGAGS